MVVVRGEEGGGAEKRRRGMSERKGEGGEGRDLRPGEAGCRRAKFFGGEFGSDRVSAQADSSSRESTE